jgi:glyoxylase I family protein
MSLKDIHTLDYVVLLCRDLPRTRAFYLDVMGFALAHDAERWVSFRVGTTLLTLKPRGPSLAWDDGPAVAGSAAVQLAFRVPPAAVEACHAELVGKGVTILQPPKDLPAWRHRTLFFRDPEDNVIEIYAEI